MSNHHENEEKLDQLIKDAFKLTLDRIEVPSEKEEWAKFEAKYGDMLFKDNNNEEYLTHLFENKNLDQEENKTVYSIKSKSKEDTNEKRDSSVYLRAVVAASIIIVALVFSMVQPQKASAIGDWFLQFFKIKTGETTESIHRSQNISGQQRGEITEIRTVEASLEEIQKICPYEVGTPAYLPENIQERQLFYQEFDDLFSVLIEYFDGGKKVLILNQRNFFGDNELAKGYDTDDSEIKTTLINGNEAHLFEYKNNVNEIIWNHDRVIYELKGEMSLEELIRIAESIK